MRLDRRPAIDLLEESVDLLRRAPATAWAWYLAGAAPFWGVFLIFWSRMTGVTDVPDPLFGTLILAMLFGFRQYSRSRFARLLYESLAGVELPGEGLTDVATPWFFGVLRLPMLLIPAPAVTAFFRNIAVTNSAARAAALANKGGDQTGALLAMIPVTALIWINVFTGMVALPMLFKIFTGRQTIATRNPAALMNGVTMAASLIVTWSIVDVTLAAFYTLRVYYGEAEDTGADLLARWRRAASKILVAVLIAVCCSSTVRADTDLNKAIDRVLTEKPYQWRKPLATTDRQNAFVAWTDNLRNSIAREWERFKAWLRSLRPDESRVPGGAPPAFGLRIVSWLVIAVLAGVFVALLLRSRRIRRSAPDGATAPTPFDLEDPSLLANQMPDHEWLSLAREWTAKGDCRMALRAYFLANLAYLGSRELLAIGRAKSNLDYLGELRRRARMLSGLDALFTANIRSFETAWYGLHPVDENDVNVFAANFERMRALAG